LQVFNQKGRGKKERAVSQKGGPGPFWNMEERERKLEKKGKEGPLRRTKCTGIEEKKNQKAEGGIEGGKKLMQRDHHKKTGNEASKGGKGQT